MCIILYNNFCVLFFDCIIKRRRKRGNDILLAKLTINLEADSEEFGYYQSSNLQGILMEQIDSEYAELLHGQGMNPYSQFYAAIMVFSGLSVH